MRHQAIDVALGEIAFYDWSGRVLGFLRMKLNSTRYNYIKIVSN